MTTSNYNLPQWKNGDKFQVIGQLNPAFTTIDTTMKATESTANSALTQAKNAATKADKAASESKAAQSASNTALTTANAAKESADGKVAYGTVKLVEDASGNGVIVTLGVING